MSDIEEEALAVAERFYNLYSNYLCTPQMSGCCGNEDCCGEQDWDEIKQIAKDIVAEYEACKGDVK